MIGIDIIIKDDDKDSTYNRKSLQVGRIQGYIKRGDENFSTP